ncbi:Hypothetical protein POVR1_LOCUS500 [uncultured virus]|nr:Hypothetical protein POVR1_LOCUS500 [uncultured virus]
MDASDQLPVLPIDVQMQIFLIDREGIRMARQLSKKHRQKVRDRKFEIDLLDEPPSMDELLSYFKTFPPYIVLFIRLKYQDDDVIEHVSRTYLRNMCGDYIYIEGTICSESDSTITMTADDDPGRSDFESPQSIMDNLQTDSEEIIYDLVMVYFTYYHRSLIFGETLSEAKEIAKKYTLRYLEKVTDYLSISLRLLYLHDTAKLLLVRTSDETAFLDKISAGDPFEIDYEQITSMCLRLQAELAKKVEHLEWI